MCQHLAARTAIENGVQILGRLFESPLVRCQRRSIIPLQIVVEERYERTPDPFFPPRKTCRIWDMFSEVGLGLPEIPFLKSFFNPLLCANLQRTGAMRSPIWRRRQPAISRE